MLCAVLVHSCAVLSITNEVVQAVIGSDRPAEKAQSDVFVQTPYASPEEWPVSLMQSSNFMSRVSANLSTEDP